MRQYEPQFPEQERVLRAACCQKEVDFYWYFSEIIADTYLAAPHPRPKHPSKPPTPNHAPPPFPLCSFFPSRRTKKRERGRDSERERERERECVCVFVKGKKKERNRATYLPSLEATSTSFLNSSPPNKSRYYESFLDLFSSFLLLHHPKCRPHPAVLSPQGLVAAQARNRCLLTPFYPWDSRTACC